MGELPGESKYINNTFNSNFSNLENYYACILSFDIVFAASKN